MIAVCSMMFLPTFLYFSIKYYILKPIPVLCLNWGKACVDCHCEEKFEMSETEGKKIYEYTQVMEPFSCDFRTQLLAGNTDFHMHSCHEIYYLVDGKINYFVEQSCYPLEAGDMIMFSNQEIHKAINLTDQPFQRLVIHINPQYFRAFCTPETNLLSCFVRKPGVGNQVKLLPEEQKRLLSLAHQTEGYKDQKKYGDDIVALSLLLQILVLVNQAYQRCREEPSQPVPHRVQMIMNYIDSHLAAPMTLDSISRDLSLDKYYLSHLFKQETESSIFQYILVKRVALAKELLAEGANVTEAGLGAGFNDYSNFIRSFRLTTGFTPGQFRKMQAQKE